MNLLLGAWFVAGDFNCIRYQDEKLGGNLVTANKLTFSLRQFYRDFGAFGLQNLGGQLDLDEQVGSQTNCLQIGKNLS